MEKSAASQGPVACGLQSQMSGSYVVTTGEPLTEARSENDESALSMPWNLPLEALLYEVASSLLSARYGRKVVTGSRIRIRLLI